MRCRHTNVLDYLEEFMPPDQELLDLIEWAFLDAQIDGETLSLAFAWAESNDVQVH
jgi:hypothetical protein